MVVMDCVSTGLKPLLDWSHIELMPLSTGFVDACWSLVLLLCLSGRSLTTATPPPPRSHFGAALGSIRFACRPTMPS